MTITPTQVSCGPAGIIWGTALLNWNGSVYVYGWQSGGTSSSGIYLAMTSAANLASPGSWQLYDGMSGSSPVWGSCSSAPAALGINNPTTGFSVNSVNGSLWLIQFDYISGQVNAAGPISAHPSTTPWGFTTSSVPLYSPPTGYVAYPYFYADYEARMQPGLGPSGDVVISYNVNTAAVDTGCVSANMHDASIYRPRFIDVPVSAFNPSAATSQPASPLSARAAAASRAASISASLSMWRASLTPRLPIAGRPVVHRAALTTGGHWTRVSAAAPAAGGIDGSTDWFYMPLGGTCPSIPAPKALTVSVAPTGVVNASWPNVGTDVWYYVYFCDKTVNPTPCATEGTASPWISGFSTSQGNLWSPQPNAAIDPVGSTSVNGADTGGDTFVMYVHSFAAGNGSGGANSPPTSQQFTVQPPSTPTGLTVSISTTSTTKTYNLSWQQVTYPSTSVYYIVNYCDSTATSCSDSNKSTWTKEPWLLATAAQYAFPSADKLEFCVQATNLGGTSTCSNVVT